MAKAVEEAKLSKQKFTCYTGGRKGVINLKNHPFFIK